MVRNMLGKSCLGLELLAAITAFVVQDLRVLFHVHHFRFAAPYLVLAQMAGPLEVLATPFAHIRRPGVRPNVSAMVGLVGERHFAMIASVRLLA
jgi:hypothetical protein